MTPDQKFWVTIWSLATVAFILLVTSITAYNLYTNTLISSSRDPIGTACALGHGDEPICIQKGAK